MDRSTAPLLVAMPVTPATMSIVRPVAVLLNAKFLPAVVTDAAIVPIALAPVKSTALPAAIPRAVAATDPAL